MNLVELFLSNPNISEWSVSDLKLLKEFSSSELDVILKTLASIDKIPVPTCEGWQ
ncbi:hypothetical protein [Metabacillus fastidiosus]|uniref:hypothetical protein n=1 Tax=Metabacillus fastidiosus TaxID=1458 RepID=UPI003D2A5BF6